MERASRTYRVAAAAQSSAPPSVAPAAPRGATFVSDAQAGVHAMVAGGLVATLSLLSLTGWMLAARPLTALLPGAPTLKVNTSFGLTCAAVSLVARGYLLSTRHAGRRVGGLSTAATLLAVIPLLIGAVTLVEYVFAVDAGIDQLLLADHWTRRSAFPGRPTWFSALGLMLASLPLLLGGQARERIMFHASVFLLSTASWLNLAVFVFNLNRPAHQPGIRTLSASAALCFLALAYGALWLRPSSSLMRVLLSNTLAGLSARRLLPVGLLLPGVLGGVYLACLNGSWFSMEVGLALFATGNTVGYVFLTWLNAHNVEQRERTEAEAGTHTAQALLLTETALATATAYLQAAPGAMFVVDKSGRIEILNSQTELLFAYPGEALVGMDISELVAESSREVARDMHATFCATHAERRSRLALQRTMVVLRRDGTELEVEVSLREVQTEHGGRVIVSVHDVSAYRAAQRALQQVTERLKLATEAVRIGIWDWNLETNQLVWEPLMYELYGLPAGTFGNTFEDWRKRIVPEDLDDLDDEVRAAIAEHRDVHTEFRVRRPDGAVRVFSGRALIQRDGAGRPVRMLGADMDITAQHDAEARLRASERRFRAIFDSSFQFIGLLAPDGELLEANRTALEFIDVPASEVIGKPFWETPWWDVSTSAQAELKQAVARAAQGDFVRFSTLHRGKGEGLSVVDFSLKPIRDEHGEVVLLVPEGRDVTDIEQARVALEESEERFRTAMEYAAIGIALVGIDGRFLKVNRALCTLVGYTEPELLQLTFQQITLPQDLDADLAASRELLAGRIDHYQMEKRYIHKLGHPVWALLSGALVRSPDGAPRMFVAELQDIGPLKANEAKLRGSVAEKEVLLREIHHRVKNNLQVISSILRLQSEQTSSAEIRGMFHDSQTRIQTMALIHERLYQSRSLASIDFSAHLRELAAMLLRFHGHRDRTVRLELSTEPATLNLDTAIPLGLIANELITNALKHAFQGRREGTLSIDLIHRADLLTLTVADDGVGLPEDLDFNASKSLGMRLIKALTRQLRGTISVERVAHSSITIVCPVHSVR